MSKSLVLLGFDEVLWKFLSERVICMERRDVQWYSPRLQMNMRVKIYGSAVGVPFLAFPTEEAMSDNFENFGMIDTLAPALESQQIQLYCVDSVDSETWSNLWGDKAWRAQRQELYYGYVVEEVVPLIRSENWTNKRPIAMGCSLGGMHAAIVFFRRPDIFGGVLSLSGTYDGKYYMEGWSDPVLYDNSPLDFLANMKSDHTYIDTYNQRRIVLCVGQGRWEEEERRTTALMGDLLFEKGINAWVDFWGYDVDHDWEWWKKQALYFLPYMLKEPEEG